MSSRSTVLLSHASYHQFVRFSHVRAPLSGYKREHQIRGKQILFFTLDQRLGYNDHVPYKDGAFLDKGSPSEDLVLGNISLCVFETDFLFVASANGTTTTTEAIRTRAMATPTTTGTDNVNAAGDVHTCDEIDPGQL